MSSVVHLPSVIASILVLLGMSISIGSHSWEAHKRAPWVGTMLNGTKCDGGQVAFGPYDYLQRNSLKAQLEVVEESHFNEDVESLAKGMSTAAMGDIHYTLQTWPNHHRALNSALRYRLQHRELWGVGNNTAQNYPAECYLQRAMQFSPNDPIPYMLHGLLMHQMKEYEGALKSYRMAVKLRPDDLITQYNMGLTLVELKKYREAQKIADKVYAAGFPLPGLSRKLADAKRPKAKPRVAQTKPSISSTESKPEGPVAAVPNAPTSQEVTAQQTDLQSGTDGETDQQALTDESALETVTTQELTVEPNASADQQSANDEADAPAQAEMTKAPQLTAEQTAILEQALKNQAAKKTQTTSEAIP